MREIEPGSTGCKARVPPAKLLRMGQTEVQLYSTLLPRRSAKKLSAWACPRLYPASTGDLRVHLPTRNIPEPGKTAVEVMWG